MSSEWRQIGDNPNASKMARQALELQTLHMWLSKRFRLDEVLRSPARERNHARRLYHQQLASIPSDVVLFRVECNDPEVPLVAVHQSAEAKGVSRRPPSQLSA